MNAAQRQLRVVPSAPLIDDVNVVVTGSGPHTLVLIHGFSDNLTTWRRVVPALAVEHRVIAVDLPGHGATARAWTRPLLDGYVDMLAEVLDRLGVDSKVSLMGNSMGAAVAALFASRHPDRVDSVVLIGMPGVTGVPVAWRAAASRPASMAMRTALRPVPVTQLVKSFGWIYSHAASPRARSIDPMAMASYRGCYVDRDRLFGLSDIARALLAELRTARLRDLLPTLDVPVLQVWGRHDRLVPPRHVTASEATVVLPGCGHCPQLDAPDLLLDTVTPFLQTHSLSDDERSGALMRAAGS